jgi:hypothetical protein
VSTSDQAVCSKCGTRIATTHIFYGGTGKSVVVCDECIATEHPMIAAISQEAKNAKCRYCGGSPCSGGMDTIAQVTKRPPANQWMCVSCSTEYSSLMERELHRASKDLGAAEQLEQIEQLKKIGQEVEAHMRAFVVQRDN